MWLAALVVAVFVAPNLLVLATGAATSASPTPAYTDRQQVAALFAALVLQLVLFALALLPLLATRRLDKRLLGPARRGLVWAGGAGVVTAVAATIGSYGVNALLLAFLERQEPVQQQLLEGAVAGGSSLVLVIVMAVVVAPITEEVVFRGLLFRSLADRFGGAVGVVCSAAIFAAVHVEVMLSQPVALAGLFVIGAVLAEAYRRTGALAVPMLGHALFNASSIGLTVLLDRAATTAVLVTAVLPG